MRLTKRDIDSFSYEGKAIPGGGETRDVRWDDVLPGLGLRIYPSGRKAFVLSYRAGGRKRLMTLGRYGVLTLDEARDRGRRALLKATDGDDPMARRNREAGAPTMGDLYKRYLEHAKANKRSWAEDERRIERHLSRLRSRKAESITRSEVAALHAKLGSTAPYEANRLLALLSRMFNLARRWELVPEGHANPAADIDKFKEQKRDRWVHPDELPKLVAAIDTEPSVYVRAALWLYLLTGVRKSELLAARWGDIDWSRAELKLPRTKAGRVHYVPLSGPALKILESLPRKPGNPYILPGAHRGEHLVNIDKAWRRIRAAAGVEDVRLHDLRRTVGSWLAQAGNSLHLIGRVLNHSNVSTTAIYARFGEDQVRAALESHADALMGVATGKKADVVKIRGRR